MSTPTSPTPLDDYADLLRALGEQGIEYVYLNPSIQAAASATDQSRLLMKA